VTRPAPDAERFPILFDMDLMRPGCAILQVLANADRVAFDRFFGGSPGWLTQMTPGMKVYRGTAEQWEMASRNLDKVMKEAR
jgi:hypothetical protein